jgi:hypothetical protein
MPRHDEHPAAAALSTLDWELGRLRADFPGWDITATAHEVTAVRDGRRITAGSPAVMRVHLGDQAASDVRTGYCPELAELIRAYRDRWEIIPLSGGGYKAYPRPRPPDPVAITAGSAVELRALLGAPDSHDEEPGSPSRVIVSLRFDGIEARRFLAAEPADPEQWELVNVSTGDAFTPHHVDCTPDPAGCLLPVQRSCADITAP